MATISSILLHHTETVPPTSIESVVVSPTGGLVGDSHDGGRSHRQVLVVDAGVLQQHGLKPGDLREQITVEGIAVDSLAPGTLVAFGEAVAEVLGECKPCLTIGEYLGVTDAEAFRDSMVNQRGMFVIFNKTDAGSKLSVGDEVRVL